MKVFFSNIGYAKGIDGTLWQHFCRLSRHLYCSIPLQQQVLGQLKSILKTQDPDLCCLVEVDSGSLHTAYYNQLHFLLDDGYPFHDIADKYGANSNLGRMPLYRGKCNAFLSKTDLKFERLYFVNGSKRLIYKIVLPGNIHLFFAHFALGKKVRELQMEELKQIILACPGEAVVMADFNILHGFSEIAPLLQGTDLKLLNKEHEHTFTLHRYRWTLDLCLCSESLVSRTSLQVIPQPFSDHAGLLLDIQ